MAVRLNHTIAWCRDKEQSASFLTDTLGLAPATAFGPFLVVEFSNDASIAFHESDGAIAPQHYAFLINEDEFDEIFNRIRHRRIAYWADPALRNREEINRADGGRGLYFKDPDAHLMEIITRPYGSG